MYKIISVPSAPQLSRRQITLFRELLRAFQAVVKDHLPLISHFFPMPPDRLAELCHLINGACKMTRKAGAKKNDFNAVAKKMFDQRLELHAIADFLKMTYQILEDTLGGDMDTPPGMDRLRALQQFCDSPNLSVAVDASYAHLKPPVSKIGILFCEGENPVVVGARLIDNYRDEDTKTALVFNCNLIYLFKNPTAEAIHAPTSHRTVHLLKQYQRVAADPKAADWAALAMYAAAQFCVERLHILDMDRVQALIPELIDGFQSDIQRQFFDTSVAFSNIATHAFTKVRQSSGMAIAYDGWGQFHGVINLLGKMRIKVAEGENQDELAAPLLNAVQQQRLHRAVNIAYLIGGSALAITMMFPLTRAILLGFAEFELIFSVLHFGNYLLKYSQPTGSVVVDTKAINALGQQAFTLRLDQTWRQWITKYVVALYPAISYVGTNIILNQWVTHLAYMQWSVGVAYLFPLPTVKDMASTAANDEAEIEDEDPDETDQEEQIAWALFKFFGSGAARVSALFLFFYLTEMNTDYYSQSARHMDNLANRVTEIDLDGGRGEVNFEENEFIGCDVNRAHWWPYDSSFEIICRFTEATAISAAYHLPWTRIFAWLSPLIRLAPSLASWLLYRWVVDQDWEFADCPYTPPGVPEIGYQA